jgi:hypothetical protein
MNGTAHNESIDDVFFKHDEALFNKLTPFVRALIEASPKQIDRITSGWDDVVDQFSHIQMKYNVEMTAAKNRLSVETGRMLEKMGRDGFERKTRFGNGPVRGGTIQGGGER